MKKVINKIMAMAIVTVMSVMAFTIPAEAKTQNAFVGSWRTSYGGVTCDMVIWDDDEVTVVYSNQPRLGYIYNYVIDEKGLFIAYTDEHETVAEIGMSNYNQLLDTDGNIWQRVK